MSVSPMMAHAGDELRLVLARHLQLPALVLDLVEQARVLDRQHRLRGEGLQKFNDVLSADLNCSEFERCWRCWALFEDLPS
jgi:hypothetical protein